MKSYDVEGNMKKFTFRCKFMTKWGPVFAKNWGWDPIDTFAVLMEDIEKITLKKSNKHKDLLRSKNRRTKYSE